MITDEQRAKLPVYVRNYIGKLERDLQDDRNALAQLSNHADGSPISYGYNAGGLPRGFIPDGPVHFQTTSGRVTATVRGGKLCLCGEGAMSIFPRAANTFDVELLP